MKLASKVAALEVQLARVQEAAELAWRYGMIDGAHHKQWVIDQMLRAILGDVPYAKIMEDYNSDDDYCDWDEGIAP